VSKIGELVLGLPTGAFTIGLVFCLTWWLSSFVLGGFDGSDDPIPGRGVKTKSGAPRTNAKATSAAKASRSHARHHRASERRAVPASLRWTVGVTAGWIVSLIGAAIVRAADPHTSIRIVLLAGVGALALAATMLLGRAFSTAVAPMFKTIEGPSRQSLVGALARVRTSEVTALRGEAKVITGPSAGAIVPVRSPQQSFGPGELVHLIQYDDALGAFFVAEVDDVLIPDEARS
jgi:hypothetical protein